MSRERDRDAEAGGKAGTLKPERVQKKPGTPSGGALKPERVQRKPAPAAETSEPVRGRDRLSGA